jgi:hypothetical protein
MLPWRGKENDEHGKEFNLIAASLLYPEDDNDNKIQED